MLTIAKSYEITGGSKVYCKIYAKDKNKKVRQAYVYLVDLLEAGCL
ncbi:MAG: hypothetical protein QXZ07_06910 [Nitrososphaerales archaeon]